MGDERMLRKCFLHTHVTALRIIEPKLLLEGCGGFLNVYSLESTLLLDSIDLFRGARIHGIQSSNHKEGIIVYGGKQIAVVNADVKGPNEVRLRVASHWREVDWIRDAKFTNESKFLVILTAHNNLLIHNSTNFDEVVEIKGKERCILYSGKILGDTADRLSILSGTVFGEVLVWGASVSDTGSNHFNHQLPGHNGVIFSVNYDLPSRTVISTSDDRSVRTWRVETRSARAADDETDLLWAMFKACTIRPQHELYGHEARVWNSVIIRHERIPATDESTLIASLGEDSRVCLWDLPTGRLLCKLDAHPGASVWAADWNARTLVTGGGDGATRLWNEEHIHETLNRQLAFDDGNHVPRQVAITSAGYVLVTQLGSVRVWRDERWIAAYENELLGSGGVMDCDGDRIALGTRTGSVFLFVATGDGQLRLDTIHELDASSKIYSVHLLGEHELIACLDRGRLFTMMHSLGGDSCSSRSSYVLPDGKQRWPSCVVATLRHLLIGDRDGSLHLYSKQTDVPIESFKSVHGKNGITDVKADPQGQGLYCTAGKDGRVGVWRLDEDQSKLDLLSITSTGLGWIARLHWTHGQHHLVYFAFSSDRFVVWSSEQQRSLMRVVCGGGHRSWDVSVSPNKRSTFVFIKDKHVYENGRASSGVFAPTLAGRCGGHAKSICSAKFLLALDGRSGGGPLLLTGSEDTAMRLSLAGDRSIRSLAVIGKHVSSVRALGVKQMTATTWLCVSGGGRAQLCVSVLTIAGQHVIHHDVKSHLLRGWLRRAMNKPWTQVGELDVVPDPETRYMDVDIVDRGGGVFHIVAACSDSLVRMFELDLERRRLELIHELDHHGCCVLRVKTVTDSAGGTLLVSTDTRGTLAMWDVTSVSESHVLTAPFGSTRIHQSGVNSVDCCWTEPDELLVLTGGDDNALICTRIRVNGAVKRFERLGETGKVLPHAAQISGVALLRGGRLAVSVSLDQRLVVWRLTGTRLDWLDAACCDVADVQGLDVLASHSGTWLCVYGQGIQIFRVSFAAVPS